MFFIGNNSDHNGCVNYDFHINLLLCTIVQYYEIIFKECKEFLDAQTPVFSRRHPTRNTVDAMNKQTAKKLGKKRGGRSVARFGVRPA